jgi:hypothetical protein
MTARETALGVINSALDSAVGNRVLLHEQRQEKAIDAPTYIAGLKAVREVEEALEPLRRALGAESSRALELVQERAA